MKKNPLFLSLLFGISVLIFSLLPFCVDLGFNLTAKMIADCDLNINYTFTLVMINIFMVTILSCLYCISLLSVDLDSTQKVKRVTITYVLWVVVYSIICMVGGPMIFFVILPLPERMVFIPCMLTATACSYAYWYAKVRPLLTNKNNTSN